MVLRGRPDAGAHVVFCRTLEITVLLQRVNITVHWRDHGGYYNWSKEEWQTVRVDQRSIGDVGNGMPPAGAVVLPDAGHTDSTVPLPMQ